MNTKTVEHEDFQNMKQKARAMKKTYTKRVISPNPWSTGICHENIRSPTVSTLQNMKIVTSSEGIEYTAF